MSTISGSAAQSSADIRFSAHCNNLSIPPLSRLRILRHYTAAFDTSGISAQSLRMETQCHPKLQHYALCSVSYAPYTALVQVTPDTKARIGGKHPPSGERPSSYHCSRDIVDISAPTNDNITLSVRCPWKIVLLQLLFSNLGLLEDQSFARVSDQGRTSLQITI